MFRNPRWLRYDGYTINLDKVELLKQSEKGRVEVFFNGQELPIVLDGITLNDIGYFLKHGKLPKGRR
jgi:hypothetical protein